MTAPMDPEVAAGLAAWQAARCGKPVATVDRVPGAVYVCVRERGHSGDCCAGYVLTEPLR